MPAPLPGLIRPLLPGVTAVECFGDRVDARLFPVELAHVADATPARQREFATGRWCARAAFQRLGVPAGPVPVGPAGAPLWPAGIVGSLTHTVGYRAAAVTRADHATGIGIDAEPHAPLPEDVRDHVLSGPERDLLPRPAGQPVHWDRIGFCAKEAVFKAWWPQTGVWLDFADIAVRLLLGGRFDAWVCAEPGLPRIVGGWRVDHGLVVTAVTLDDARVRECAA